MWHCRCGRMHRKPQMPARLSEHAGWFPLRLPSGLRSTLPVEPVRRWVCRREAETNVGAVQIFYRQILNIKQTAVSETAGVTGVHVLGGHVGMRVCCCLTISQINQLSKYELSRQRNAKAQNVRNLKLSVNIKTVNSTCLLMCALMIAWLPVTRFFLAPCKYHTKIFCIYCKRL